VKLLNYPRIPKPSTIPTQWIHDERRGCSAAAADT